MRVCGQPTVVRSVAAGSSTAAVAVLCPGSDDLALLRTDSNGKTTATIHHITPGANEVAVSPQGDLVELQRSMAWVAAEHTEEDKAVFVEAARRAVAP